jgi:HK97 family phage prohead protease
MEKWITKLYVMKKNRPVYYKGFEIKDFKEWTDSRKVSGYLAAFGNIDSDGEMLMPGCFLKSINDRGPSSPTARKIPYLNQHEMEEPIGVFTLLQEDEKGLYFEAVIDDTEAGNDALVRYKSGSYNQHSIGFCYVWDKCKFETMPNHETGEDIQVFMVYEVKLYEGSAVTMGANENTPFTGFKSMQIEDQRKKLNIQADSLLSELSQEKQYQFRQLISKYIALSEVEPLDAPKQKKAVSYDRLIELFTIQKQMP